MLLLFFLTFSVITPNLTVFSSSSPILTVFSSSTPFLPVFAHFILEFPDTFIEQKTLNSAIKTIFLNENLKKP